MRKISLIVAILGLSILLLYLFTKPIEVNSLKEIKAGTIVKVKGQVSNEKEFSFGKTFNINNITIFCKCQQNYAGKNIEVTGIVEDYYELRVKATKIKFIF